MSRPLPNRVPPRPDDPRHGQYRGYIAGCRRPCCVAAERAYQRGRKRDQAYGRPRTVPSIGAVRRIQALMANGWPGTHLAEQLGLGRANLPTHTRYERMRPYLAEQVSRLYDELHLQAGPSERTRRRSEAYGFLLPEAWEGVDIDDPDALPIDLSYDHAPPGPCLDEVAIERRLAGERVSLTREELAEAIRRAAAKGVENIHDVLHTSPVTVTRHLKGTA